MKLTLELDIDNAAFDDDSGLLEVARILRRAADEFGLANWLVGIPHRLLDVNGNNVGSFVVTEESS